MALLRDDSLDKRIQYCIENLFAVKKSKYKNHEGVIKELDLVEAEDQFIHDFDLTETINAEDSLNIFKFDPFYEKTEQEWDEKSTK